jgi:hypothetical protein
MSAQADWRELVAQLQNQFFKLVFLDWNVLDLHPIHCLLHRTLPFLKVTLVLLKVAAAVAVILLHLGGLVFLA